MGFPISKADIAAFKQADDISFHTQPDGASSIRSSVRARDPKGNNPFGTSEKTRETQCECMIRDYIRDCPGSDGTTPLVKKVRAFEMIHAAKWCDAWQTIAGFVREGDELTLYWGRNARWCPLYDKPAYVGDMLTLVVWRGMKKFAFLIDVQVGEDNSARMIRAA
jgi:hypothetical protein